MRRVFREQFVRARTAREPRSARGALPYGVAYTTKALSPYSSVTMPTLMAKPQTQRRGAGVNFRHDAPHWAGACRLMRGRSRQGTGAAATSFGTRTVLREGPGGISMAC